MLIHLIQSHVNFNISITFIPNVINEWNTLYPDICSSTSYNTLLKFIRSVQRKTFIINDSVGVKLLTRL